MASSVGARNCGCNSGRAGWHQNWRGPLRAALDSLRDVIRPLYETESGALFKDPWAARNDYVDVLLDRRTEIQDQFLEKHSRKTLNAEEKVKALQLLEMQRHAMLMYTSCGWFFDEISGPETVQVLMHAGRSIQLAEELFGRSFEDEFLTKLALAPSNVPQLHPTGKGSLRALRSPHSRGLEAHGRSLRP